MANQILLNFGENACLVVPELKEALFAGKGTDRKNDTTESAENRLAHDGR